MRKAYLFCALMIGAVIFEPINAQARPVAGVSAEIEKAQWEPPITDWQKDILEAAICEDEISESRSEDNSERNSRKGLGKQGYGSGGRDSLHLTRQKGIFDGPSGRESYYNLPMGTVVKYMEDLGYHYDYWIREDGVKMYGQYVMVAANLSKRPKGTILPTSLGLAIVCDTGTFVETNSCQLDIAVDW